MKNFVSIIIPTYNEEKNLENALKAIRNQDYKKYEIIVSDSKSKDRTRAIAKKYGARVVIGERKGIGAGRNLGAKFAKGDILIFVDADTIMMMNTVGEFVKSFSKKHVIGVTCPVIPSKMKIRNFAIYLAYNQIVWGSTKTRNPHVGGICVAYKKKNFSDSGGFNESLAAFEDIDLSRRMGKKGKIFYNEETFVITSPRRVEAWGHFATFRKYLKFYLKYLVARKIALDEYEPIR